MQLKWGINKHVLMFIDWMREDKMFMVNVDQYLLRYRWIRLLKTCLYCLLFMYMSFEEEKWKYEILQLMQL